MPAAFIRGQDTTVLGIFESIIGPPLFNGTCSELCRLMPPVAFTDRGLVQLMSSNCA